MNSSPHPARRRSATPRKERGARGRPIAATGRGCSRRDASGYAAHIRFVLLPWLPNGPLKDVPCSLHCYARRNAMRVRDYERCASGGWVGRAVELKLGRLDDDILMKMDCEVDLPLPLLSPILLPEGTLQTHPRAIDFTASLEALVRSAIATCSPRLIVPCLPAGMRRLGATLRPSALSASAQKRLTVVDRRDRIWEAVKAYFVPITEGLNRAGQSPPIFLAWDTYMLMLATRWDAQVYMNLGHLRAEILSASHHASFMSDEALARLAVLRGAFNGLHTHVAMPALRVLAGSGASFRERIDDILDDAYLLEASFLRRTLSVAANRAAIYRDLRRLLRWIVKARGWAAGLIKVGEQAAIMPHAAGETISALMSAISAGGQVSGPVIISADRPPWLSLFRVSANTYSWDCFMRPLVQEVSPTEIRTYRGTYFHITFGSCKQCGGEAA